MCVGEKIKKLRIENGLTQKEFADKIYVTRSAVAKWEQNRGVPCADTFEIICKNFDVDSSYFMDSNVDEFKIVETMATVKTISKKNKFLTIGGIALSILLVGTTVLSICLGLKKDEDPVGEDNTQFNYSIKNLNEFGGGKVSSLDIEKQRIYFNDEEYITIDENTPLYDFQGNIFPFNSLINYMNNDGLFNYDGDLKVYICKKQDVINYAMVFNKIRTVDNSYGFLFSTSLCGELSEPPIFLPEIGLDNTKWKGNYSFPDIFGHLSSFDYCFKFPYLYSISKSLSSNKGYSYCYLDDYNYSYTTNLSAGVDDCSATCLGGEFVYSLNVSNDLSSVNCYRIDDSKNRYTKIHEFSKSKNRIETKMEQLYIDDENKKCIEVNNCILNVNFVDTVENIKIEDLDKDMNVLESHSLEFYEQHNAFSSKRGGSDVKYMRITITNNGAEDVMLYSSTSKVTYKVKSYYGYAEELTFNFDATQYGH